MRYVLLIHVPEPTEMDFEDPAAQEEMYAYAMFSKSVKDAGVMVSGEAMQPVAAGTVVRVRDGETQATDGAYSDTPEQISGFYVLDCADRDEAVAWAAKIPGAAKGAIEVRPIMEFDMP